MPDSPHTCALDEASGRLEHIDGSPMTTESDPGADECPLLEAET